MAKDDKASRNMMGLAQTIARLGEAIQQRAGVRPSAMVRE